MACSVEREAMRMQIGRERRAFGFGGLPRLVFRPAIESGLAELGVRRAAGPCGMA